MNILFLTAATGGGHAKASQALIEHMERRIPGSKSRMADALKFVSPAMDRLITGTYLHTIKNAPYIYRKLYELSEKEEVWSNFVKGFNGILAPGLLKIFNDEMPDAVICTHTVPLQMVSRLKRAGCINIPAIGIVTDYTNHLFWKLQGIDAFIVAHDYIKSDMVKMGLCADRIYPYGIPVSARFTDSSVSDRPRGEIVKNQVPVILLMGGSLGLCNMKAVFLTLLELPMDLRIIAVTGYNTKLRQELTALSSGYEKQVSVLGYTNDISMLMDSASVIITKPGGVTISEALVKGLPIFIMDPLPGQEERNASFLSNAGAAIRLPNDRSLPQILGKALKNRFLLQKMSSEAGKLAKPNACEDITGLVRDLVLRNCSYPMHADTHIL